MSVVTDSSDWSVEVTVVVRTLVDLDSKRLRSSSAIC